MKFPDMDQKSFIASPASGSDPSDSPKVFPHDNIVCIHMCDEYMKSIDSGFLSHALVHFVIDRASLFTDHRISGRPIRRKKKHFRKI